MNEQTSNQSLIGQIVGGYRIVELLGEGANGSVWKAEDPQLKTYKAIKVLPPHLAANRTDRERFARGSRAAAQLDHPGIAGVYLAEFDGPIPYIVSEFVDGKTINQTTDSGPLAPKQAVELVIQAAQALAHAHEHGVIHRDISGGNIMVTKNGRCKIVDFGLAIEKSATRDTTKGTVIGTWAYLAPEVIRDEAVSPTRDAFALGGVFYQMLTGRLPFPAESLEGLVHQILNEEPNPPSFYQPEVPAALDRIALLALEKKPELRCTVSRLETELTAIRLSGVLDSIGAAPVVQESLVSRILRPLRQLTRRMLTLPPSQLRKYASMAALSVVSIAGSIWAIDRLIDKGPVAPRVASLHVMPLFNESTQVGFSHIGHSLAEHLVGRLDRLDGLLVLPYRRWIVDADPEDLCEQLNVEGVLEGAFAIGGGQVRIRIDLITANGDRITLTDITSIGYDRAAVELAEAVAGELKSRLTPEEREDLAVAPSDNEAAFEALSRAVDAHQRGERDVALQFYEEAVRLDPGLAKAYVGIGAIHYDRYFRGKASSRALDVAESNFRQALALEPDNGGAERGIALLHYERGERDSSLARGIEAAKRSRGTIDALLLPAWAYFLSYLNDMAIPLVKRVIELDPLNDEAYWLLTVNSVWAGMFEDAIAAGEEYFRRFGEDPEVHTWMGIAESRMGRPAMAAQHFNRALALFGDNTQIYVSLYAGQHFWANGDRDRARSVWADGLEVADKRLTNSPDNVRLRAIRLGLLGRVDRTVDVLAELKDYKQALKTTELADVVGGWHIALHGTSSERQAVLDFIVENVGPENVFWTSAAWSAFPEAYNSLLEDPRVAALVVAAEKHNQKLRERYKL